MAKNKQKLVDKLANLPDVPGVYLFKSHTGGLLYVGKAKALADRVRSYFRRGNALTPRIVRMVEHVADLEVIVTGSELEALILESNLVKKHRPRYNVVLRDDKQYPYLRLAVEENFPRLEIVRRVQRDGALYFGPYVPTNALRETVQFLRRIFPLPNCNIVIDGTAERACIELEIGRCLAPCTGQQSQPDYKEMMRQVRLFLEGKDTDLIKQLRARMEAEAERLNFEEAARLRDRLAKIERVLERQRITRTESVDLDVIGLARAGDVADVQVLFIRGGLTTGRKDFLLTGVAEVEADEILRDFLRDFYNKEGLIPPEVAVSEEPYEAELLEHWLSERRGAGVHLISPARGKNREALRLAQDNARLALDEHLRLRAQGTAAAQELQRLLGLARAPRRIEAFDISNIQGDQATGSMVVWEEDRAKKADYRHFRIRTVEGPDDFASMREVVRRRYGGILKDKLPRPDLIVIDGGRGQLSAALDALRELTMNEIDVIGLAKERRGGAPAKRVGAVAGEGPRSSSEKFERVFLRGRPDPVPLDPVSPATHLLQRIRDEAHRFAITYHRKLRGKAMVLNELNDVPGIGPGRKRALLRAFRSMDRIRRASVEELAAVPGIPKSLAEIIASRFKS